MRQTKHTLLIVLGLILAGCATHQYACPVDNSLGACRSMQDAYQASLSNNSQQTQSVFEKASDQTVTQKAESSSALGLHAVDETSQTTPLIYQPAKLYRTLIFAHVASGNVVGTHYVYWIKDKGHWQAPFDTTKSKTAMTPYHAITTQ